MKIMYLYFIFILRYQFMFWMTVLIFWWNTYASSLGLNFKLTISFSIFMDSSKVSCNVFLPILLTEIKIFMGWLDVQNSIKIYSLGQEVVGILFARVMNRWLKSLIFSFFSLLILEISNTIVAGDLSSPKFSKDNLSNYSKLVINHGCKLKYQAKALPSNVYGNHWRMTYSYWTFIKHITSINLLIISSV